MHTTKILKKVIGTLAIIATITTPFLTNNSQITKVNAISPIAQSVAITNIKIIGTQYSIDFTPSGYVPTPGGIHTHFYYNTEENTILDKMFSGPSPYLLNISTKPTNAVQLCAIVAEANHAVIANSGNCLDLPILRQISVSSSSISSSLTSLSSSQNNNSSTTLTSSNLSNSSVSNSNIATGGTITITQNTITQNSSTNSSQNNKFNSSSSSNTKDSCSSDNSNEIVTNPDGGDNNTLENLRKGWDGSVKGGITQTIDKGITIPNGDDCTTLPFSTPNQAIQNALKNKGKIVKVGSIVPNTDLFELGDGTHLTIARKGWDGSIKGVAAGDQLVIEKPCQGSFGQVALTFRKGIKEQGLKLTDIDQRKGITEGGLKITEIDQNNLFPNLVGDITNGCNMSITGFDKDDISEARVYLGKDFLDANSLLIKGKQTQGATFGEKVNAGLNAAAGTLVNGKLINPSTGIAFTAQYSNSPWNIADIAIDEDGQYYVSIPSAFKQFAITKGVLDSSTEKTGINLLELVDFQTLLLELD